MKTLRVDDKWAIHYNPDNNDLPSGVLRHGDTTGRWEYDNLVTAMFYALLGKQEDPGDTAPVETIAAAAVQIEGMTISLPRPARHGQVLHALDAMHLPDYHVHGACQGFLTSEGRFVNRVQAKQIAHIARQPVIRDNPHDRDAFSEDFW